MDDQSTDVVFVWRRFKQMNRLSGRVRKVIRLWWKGDFRPMHARRQDFSNLPLSLTSGRALGSHLRHRPLSAISGPRCLHWAAWKNLESWKSVLLYNPHTPQPVSHALRCIIAVALESNPWMTAGASSARSSSFPCCRHRVRAPCTTITDGI